MLLSLSLSWPVCLSLVCPGVTFLPCVGPCLFLLSLLALERAFGTPLATRNSSPFGLVWQFPLWPHVPFLPCVGPWLFLLSLLALERAFGTPLATRNSSPFGLVWQFPVYPDVLTNLWAGPCLILPPLSCVSCLLACSSLPTFLY